MRHNPLAADRSGSGQARLTGCPDRIELRGLRGLGTHGVLAEERERPQPFEVDVDVHCDLSDAGRSDALADTVDYGAVATAVLGVLAGSHADLLEHLAQRLVEAIFATGGHRVEAVTVTVRKLRPPVAADMVSSAVTITRERP
jgi:dihydroneopterin aldolase